jgi:histidinol-phosphate aminotransferase
MSLAEQALSYVRAISPYQPGKPITELAREMGIPVESIVKLASNENPLGMSPKARQAVEAASAGIERYPDQFELIAKSRRTLRRGARTRSCSATARTTCSTWSPAFSWRPAVRRCFAQHAFAVYPLATLSTGAELISTPAKNYGHDLTPCAPPSGRIRASSGSPTRTIRPAISCLIRSARLPRENSVPKDVVVVLDEAYNEYLPPAERVDTAAWIKDFPNLVVCRTFSKIYGLAGLRVGYGLASPRSPT